MKRGGGCSGDIVMARIVAKVGIDEHIRGGRPIDGPDGVSMFHVEHARHRLRRRSGLFSFRGFRACPPPLAIGMTTRSNPDESITSQRMFSLRRRQSDGSELTLLSRNGKALRRRSRRHAGNMRSPWRRKFAREALAVWRSLSSQLPMGRTTTQPSGQAHTAHSSFSRSTQGIGRWRLNARPLGSFT